MYDLIVKDVTVLMADGSLRPHQDVAVSHSRISRICDTGSLEETSDTCSLRPHSDVVSIDGRGCLVMPGLADCHMHTGQQLLKGRVLDALPMIWTRIMLPFESTLTPQKMALSAGLAALEMIRSGTTAFVDAGSYHMTAAAEVYAASGLRGVLSVSTMDEPGLPASIACTAEQALQKNEELFDAVAALSPSADANSPGLLRAAYSLRSLISCSEQLICGISERAKSRGALLQAHMNEYPNEINFFLQHRQMRPVEYLASLGVPDSHFISAHSLLLSEREKDLLAAAQAKVCHCPFSNCGKAVPATPSLLDRGICVGLGTDGAAHGGLSLWNEMKIFRSVINVGIGVPQSNPAIMPAAQIINMATRNGYDLIAEPDGGSIAEGNIADFIVIDIRKPHLFPTGNLVNTLLESVTAGDVRDMVVNGKLIMKNREILTLDEEKFLFEAERYIERNLI